jgi:hypothetical protein
MDQASETFLYPRFDTLTGDMLVFPQWPPTPTGPGYISLAQLAAFITSGSPIFTTVTGSTTLAPNTIGTVLIRNGTSGPITITLPSGPTLGQTILFKDATGNAGTYHITIGGSMVVAMGEDGAVVIDDRGNVVTRSTPTIDGNPSYVLGSNYMSLDVFWMGDQWGTR